MYNHSAQYGISVAKALASNKGCWKETGDLGTPGCDQPSNNTTGFSDVPAGGCFYSDFYGFGFYAYFWSATEYDDSTAWSRNLSPYSPPTWTRDHDNKDDGCSVHCLRD